MVTGTIVDADVVGPAAPSIAQVSSENCSERCEKACLRERALGQAFGRRTSREHPVNPDGGQGPIVTFGDEAPRVGTVTVTGDDRPLRHPFDETASTAKVQRPTARLVL